MAANFEEATNSTKGEVTALLLVFTEPTSSEAEAEYNQWYATVHIPQLLKHVPGLSGAFRYVVEPLSIGAAGGRHYLAIYEVRGPGPIEVIDMIRARTADGLIERNNALQLSPAPLLIAVRPWSNEP